jgi:hypothetical protein
MPEWFLPTRGERQPPRESKTEFRSEVEDDAGKVIVETRRFYHDVWETTITPGDEPDPDGPTATVFAKVDNLPEALTAHQQAAEFAADALKLTTRRAGYVGR